MPIKIAVTGAGSIGFTHRLMRDILSVPELADAQGIMEANATLAIIRRPTVKVAK